MPDHPCRICGSETRPIYRSSDDTSVTSSALLVAAPTEVDLCASCGHVQTRPALDASSYYSSAYNFRSDSAEEDDLCTTSTGESVYRSELQARIVERAVDFSQPKRVLDYGSGKALTLEILTERHPNIEPHVFDVSDAYRLFWNGFIQSTHQASFEIPSTWDGRFDLVLSFFALEHAEDPRAFVASLKSLVARGGRLMLFFPNMYGNVCDMLVVDHINHFSPHSIYELLERQGFTRIRIDTETQADWYIVDASWDGAPTYETAEKPETRVGRALEIAGSWSEARERLRVAEASRPVEERSAIYGSGIYGLFIGTSLERPENLACFLDRNPFRQGRALLGANVVSPEAVPDDVRFVYVGLNPRNARDLITGVEALARKPREYFFL